MLVARNEKGDWVSLANRTNRQQLIEERKRTSFFCPVCREKLLLKLGEKNCFHFAHFKASQCHLHSEPETPTHIQGKKDLYNWLKRQGERPVLEMYLSSIRQRADIGVPRFPKDLAFEFQCSTIQPNLLLDRNKGYLSQNVLPLWVWNQTRLKKLDHHLFSISPLEWLTRRFPFSHPPHNRIQRQKGFLTYYDPDTQLLTFLYHLLPLNTRKLWAESHTIPLSELSLQTFLYPPISPITNSLWKSDFLNQKKKWRTVFARSNSLEWHLHRLSETKGVIWKAFPGVVGNPLGDDQLIETPAYLWQGWLCLTYLLNKLKGDHLPLAEIKREFLALINKKWVVLRLMGYLEEAWRLIEAYLDGLVALNLLGRTDQKTYVIKETLQWGSPFFDDLVMEDARVLFLWDRHVKQ